MHSQLTDNLEEELAKILKVEDYSDKLAMMEDKENIEIAKLEKVMKKEHNEFKNIVDGPTNVKALHSKMNKTLKIMRKLTEENNRIVKERDEFQKAVEDSKANIGKQ